MGISSMTDKAAYAISQMFGGAKKITAEPRKVHFGTFFILTLVILLLRSLIVCWGYNALMPKFVTTLGDNKNALGNFRELTYGESILLVIAAQCLFN